MNRKRILIIEDELIHGVFLKSSIENCGYRVIDIISKGEDAIAVAVREKPDLIISDILLRGGISGVDAVEEITRHAMIPFIFLTALNEGPVLDKATRASPLAVISKPYDEKVLIDLIDSLFK